MNHQASIRKYIENYNTINTNSLMSNKTTSYIGTGKVPEFNQLSNNPKPVNYPQPSYSMKPITDYQYTPIPSLSAMQEKIAIANTTNLHKQPSRIDIKPNIKSTTVKKNIDLNKANYNSASINNTGPQYIPEISKKRTIGNLIYNNIIKSFNNIKKHHRAEYEFDHLLQKYNIVDDNGKIDKNEIRSFVKELKNTIQTNSTNKEQDLIIQEDTLFEKDTKDIEYFISIDSSDRDTVLWKNPAHYRINFGPDNNLFNSNDSKPYRPNKGFITRTFHNIKSIEIMEAIIPKCLDKNGTDFFIYPYLILEIEEFGSMYEGTNDITNRAFARLNFDKIIGNYRYFKSDKDNKIIKFFNPRIALNKITLKLTKPDGSLINFGNSILLDTLCNEYVSFNIKTYKKIYDLSQAVKKKKKKKIKNIKTGCPEEIEKSDIDNTPELCIDDEINISEQVVLPKNHILDPDLQEQNIDPSTIGIASYENINKITEKEGAIFNSFIFKITCIQRSLDTMYLDKRDG